MYYDTYFSLIGNKLREDPPDYNWLVTLFEELKNRLTNIINLTSKNKTNGLLQELEESLDVPLFKQMIENKAYTLDDFTKLCNYLFDLCLRLGSPMRDKYVKEKQNEVLEKMNIAKTSTNINEAFASVVPTFIKNINESIDFIYVDLYALI
jgi:hypothetical protein